MELKERVKVTRHGYHGTGIVVYFVRCDDIKTLKEYYAAIPGSIPMAQGEHPVAFSLTQEEQVLPGLVEEAAGTTVLTSHILVAKANEEDGIDASQEARHWRHEVGHVVFNVASWGANALAHANGVPPLTFDEKSEIAAMATEYLTACVDHDIYQQPRAASGLPLVLPWYTAKEGQ